ncbi:MAG: hypothetical protein HC872_00210 [Gammaproteobacteria bacterium]|nr:hypothetical protein [Gammaproteobacteria bacterium]
MTVALMAIGNLHSGMARLWMNTNRRGWRAREGNCLPRWRGQLEDIMRRFRVRGTLLFVTMIFRYIAPCGVTLYQDVYSSFMMMVLPWIKNEERVFLQLAADRAGL